MVYTNASDYHSLAFLMARKAKKPHRFKNVSYLPVTYKAQKNAQMNSNETKLWTLKEAKKQNAEEEKILTPPLRRGLSVAKQSHSHQQDRWVPCSVSPEVGWTL